MIKSTKMNRTVLTYWHQRREGGNSLMYVSQFCPLIIPRSNPFSPLCRDQSNAMDNVSKMTLNIPQQLVFISISSLILNWIVGLLLAPGKATDEHSAGALVFKESFFHLSILSLSTLTVHLHSLFCTISVREKRLTAPSKAGKSEANHFLRARPGDIWDWQRCRPRGLTQATHGHSVTMCLIRDIHYRPSCPSVPLTLPCPRS